MTRIHSRDSAQLTAEVIRAAIGLIVGMLFIGTICVWWIIT